MISYDLQFFGGRSGDSGMSGGGSRRSSSSMGNGTARVQRMSESELRGYIKRNNLTRAYNMTVNNMSPSYSNRIKAMRRVVADNIDKNIRRSNRNKQ